MSSFFLCLKLHLLSIILPLSIFFNLSLWAQTSQDGTVARGDFTLHYKTVGTGNPLLLLSGGPGFDVDYMMPVAQQLSAWHQCILLEQRGTGRSQPSTLTPETMNIKVMVEDIEALRISMKLSRLVILGHSWGGMLAMAYAAAHPDHVDSLVLVASGGIDSGFGSVFKDNIIARASTGERQKIQQAEDRIGHSSDPQAAYLDLFRLQVPLYFFDRERGEQFMASATKDSYHPQMAKLIQLDILKNYRLHDQLSGFSRPVLIIQGRQDPIPESTALQIRGTLPNSQLIFLDRSGHFPWLDQPEAFYKNIHRFLKIER